MASEISVLKQMSLVTALLVAGLGAFIVNGDLQPPTASDDIPVQQRLANLANLGRAPASVIPAVVVSEINLPCALNGGEIFQNFGPHVRILNSSCKEKWVPQSIVNSANNFVATIFKPEDGGFSTDYIDLNPGKNVVVITQMDHKGHSVQHRITLVRAE